MSTATLASDTVVSLPSRLPTWVPRILARAAAGVLRQPAKWPFSSGLSQGRHRALAPAAQSDVIGASAVVQPVEAPAVEVQPVVQPTPAARIPQPIVGAAHAHVSAAALSMDTMAAHSQSMGTASRALSQGVTMRQMVGDVLLVAIWGALIPGVMWLGAAAGF
ncbi:hypothetical protein [Bordetella genomosp. 4]|uniref:Uncharacterized protein n=1 Tax=Bordetella genomosp. 4 TaxID=463044 RepID=A0A261U6D3_9BORD|nr:hypothetical protein [Bordetella genomosp. 4]OZI57469.1 hypothetical protein CAL20_08730 [Bordetella genomosp. 4]